MAQIKTYARLKPTKRPYGGYEISKNVLTVHIPDSKDFLVVGSQQSLRSNLSYDIMFTDIFRPDATQEDVFDGVAKGIIQSFLNGYNGTIFAYGQTGTGKTYTVEGNTTGYSTRGLSTRALSMIYQQLENRMDDHITVCLSYLEIYQEVAYDLLNPISRSSLPMAPFAKVTVVEGPRGSCIFRGLSLHLAANEEIAQMLLLQGQANRKVAETPVNQRSSRSHAVFTVYLQVRKHDSDVLLNSKLHLVDLAGSERVSKTGVDGQQLTEAKSINLSLHHLETVIIALQTDRSTSSSCTGGGEKSKGDYPTSQSRSNTSFMSGPSSDSGTKPYKYVPYRNSLLTMVLKDSLGGNCLTAMIATISMEPENLGESISTCRFAQRVARIANNARRNEEVDDKTVIKRLRHKVANLEHQLTLLRSKGKNDSIITDDDFLSVLSEDDRSACAKIMEGFLQGVIADPVHAGIYDQSRFRECLHLLKHQYLHSISSTPQFLTSQQLQPRQVAADLPSEGTHQLQPNNPHRDSGDHAMSEATQADSSVFISQQRPPFSCSSLLSMQAPEEYFLVNEDQVIGTFSAASETGSKILERKGTQIEHIMECCSGNKYCPSYDRQRAREFKKQNQKLTSLEHEQAVKQEQLAQMSQDILMQELLGAENNLRLKLQAVEEQVIQQHAYLMQLRHNQSDAVQIAREQLVEQHLLKRQVKFYDKLSKLLENKTKLQCALSPDRDISSSVCGGSSRISMDNTIGQFKHGKGCQTCLMLEEQDQQKESLPKFDNEKFSLKPKQLDISESMSPEKIRELKQRLKMSQLQSEALFEMSSGQCQNAFDIHQVQSTNSVDSNRSLRGNECIRGYVGSHLENNMASDNECNCDQAMVHPSMASSRTGLYSKDKSYFVNFRNTDLHAKNVQEYQVSGYKENFDNDARQMKSSGFNRPEPTKRPENGSGYVMPNSILPYQQGLDSSVLFRQEDMTNNPTQQQSDVLIESPTLNGSRPIEVRSFHDPHHSHKFALDDMPAESSLLSNTMANSMDSLNNKNNSYIRFVHSINNQYQHSFNYNSNAITDTVEGFETNTENGNLTHISEHQFQPPPIVECSMISNNSTTTCAIEDATVCASDKVFIEDSAGPEIHSKNTTDSDCSSKKINIAETVINNFDEELTISPKQHNILLNTATNHDLLNKSDASLHALVHGDSSKLVSSHNTFETCCFTSHKHDSAQSHLFKLERDIIGASLSPEASPCKKCCLISSAQHKSEDHHMTPPQKSRLEMSWKRKFSILSDLRSGMKQVTDTKSMWSPSIENASAAGERNGLLYAPSVFLSFGDRIYGDNNNWKTYASLYSQNGLDSFDLKLAKYRWDKQMEDDDDDDDDDNEEYDENLSRDDSFFYQPAEEKLRSLMSEEREKMYILAVATEKSRVV